MCESKIEVCTARRLYEKGLLQAFKYDEDVKINGSVSLSKNGELIFEQDVISFYDKFNRLCFVKFSNWKEFLKFAHDYSSNYELI